MAEEKAFENKIKKYLEDNGCWYVKYFANRMTKSGIPDILASVNGYFVGIEVKATNGHPSELQKYHQRKIRESYAISIIVRPKQYEMLQILINLLLSDQFEEAYQLQYRFD